MKPITKLTRREFLQGLIAGLAVAALPKSIPISEATEAITEIVEAPGWRFIIRGGAGGMGDSLIILPPDVTFQPGLDWHGKTFVFPEPFDVDDIDTSQPITLMPWRRYREKIESLIPDDLQEIYQEALRWRRYG